MSLDNKPPNPATSMAWDKLWDFLLSPCPDEVEVGTCPDPSDEAETSSQIENREK